MSDLITDPERIKAEQEAAKVDMDSPATKKDVANYVQNYVNAKLNGVTQQSNMTANVLNLLMDFLTQRGLKKAKHGDHSRYYFSTAEWNQFLVERKAAHEAAEKLKEKPAEQPN